MYYTFRFSTLVYVLKTEMALFTWILFYRTTFSFYRELMLCLWIINCCWKSTAALNYLCWREPVSDKKGTEHIAAAWEEKRLGGKSRLVGRDIDSIHIYIIYYILYIIYYILYIIYYVLYIIYYILYIISHILYTICYMLCL